MGPQAIVAGATGRPGRRVAEISEYEPAPATTRVGVLLNGVELGEIATPPAVESFPIDRDCGQGHPWLRQPRTAAIAIEGHELPTLQCLEQRKRRRPTAEPRGQRVEKIKLPE